MTLEFDGSLEAELAFVLEETKQQLKRCEFSCEVYRHERDHARAQYENTVKILTRIHNLLYPTACLVGGKTYLFNSPHVHEQMQALSDAIRAIPDELAKVPK